MLKNKLLHFLLLVLLSSCALLNPNPNRRENENHPALTLRPFTTDYCSEWPDGNRENPSLWADCCFTHDLHYWVGGTEEERKKSDTELKNCVKISGSSLNAFLMYMGVRFGGGPGNASYSWGYGWTQDRKYSPLQKEETKRARELLLKSKPHFKRNEKKLIDSFIINALTDKITNY